MSRPLRPLTFLARSAFRPSNLARARRGFQTSIPHHDESMSALTVRFQQPKLWAWLGTATKVTLSILLFKNIVDFFLEDEEEEVDHDKIKTGEEVVPDEMPEDAIFVPLWIPKEMPRYFYKGSDPEWQSYQAFAKDRKKVKQVHDSVVESLVREVGNDPQFSQYLGPPLKTQRILLDWTYPDAAPPEYETFGLEIADEYISLGTRPLSEHHYRRLQSRIWPTSIATSLWASSKTFFQLQLAKGKQFTNVKGNMGSQGHLPQPRPINFNDIVRPVTETEPQNPKTGSRTPPEMKPSESNSTEPPISNAKKSDATPSNKLSILGTLDSLKSRLEMRGMKEEGAMAYAVFKKTLLQTRPGHLFLKRGQICLGGLVEITGTQGKVILRVQAYYDPRKSQLEGIGLAVWRRQKWRLRPRGGP